MLVLAEGWSGPITYNLQSGGVAQNLTGYTVTSDLLDRNDNPSTSTGTITLTNTTGGVVQFNPGTTMDFQVAMSPYKLRFKAVTGGLVTYFPSGDPEIIEVLL